MADSPPKKPNRLAKAKRIYRQGDAYICGMCHKRYRSVDNAKKCLIRDVKAMRDAGGGEQRRFRCGHCQNVYSTKEDARACAARCKEKLDAEKGADKVEDDLIAKLERQLAGEQTDADQNQALATNTDSIDLKKAAGSESSGLPQRDSSWDRKPAMPRDQRAEGAPQPGGGGDAWARKPAGKQDAWARKPTGKQDAWSRKPADKQDAWSRKPEESRDPWARRPNNGDAVRPAKQPLAKQKPAKAERPSWGRKSDQPMARQNSADLQPRRERRKRPERKQRIQVPHWALKKCMKDDDVLVCKRCGAEYTSVRDVVACFDIHPPLPPDQAPKVPDRMKYRTVDDQYQCRYCNNLHNTVADVVICYDSHEEEREAKRRARDERRWGRKRPDKKDKKRRSRPVGDDPLDESYQLGDQLDFHEQEDYDIESGGRRGPDDPDYALRNDGSGPFDDDRAEGDSRYSDDRQRSESRWNQGKDDGYQMEGDWKSRRPEDSDYEIESGAVKRAEDPRFTGTRRRDEDPDYRISSDQRTGGDDSFHGGERQAGREEYDQVQRRSQGDRNPGDADSDDGASYATGDRSRHRLEESERQSGGRQRDRRPDDLGHRPEEGAGEWAGERHQDQDDHGDADAPWRSAPRDSDGYTIDSAGPGRRQDLQDPQNNATWRSNPRDKDGYSIESAGPRRRQDEQDPRVDSQWRTEKNDPVYRIQSSPDAIIRKDVTINGIEGPLQKNRDGYLLTSSGEPFRRNERGDFEDSNGQYLKAGSDGYVIDASGQRYGSDKEGYLIDSDWKSPTSDFQVNVKHEEFYTERPEGDALSRQNRELSPDQITREDGTDPYDVDDLYNQSGPSENDQARHPEERDDYSVTSQGKRRSVDSYTLESSSYRVAKGDEAYRIESAATGWDRSDDGYNMRTEARQAQPEGYRLYTSGYRREVDNGYHMTSSARAVARKEGYSMTSGSVVRRGDEGYSISSSGQVHRPGDDGYTIQSEGGPGRSKGNDGYQITSSSQPGRKTDDGYQISGSGSNTRSKGEGYSISHEPDESLRPRHQNSQTDDTGSLDEAENRRKALGARFLDDDEAEALAGELLEEVQQPEKVDSLPEDVAFSDYTDLREFGFDQIIAKPDERDLSAEQEYQRRQERRMYMRVGIKYQCKACGNRYYTKSQVVGCFNKHLNPDAEPVAAPTEQAPPEQQDDPRYQRDGAKYVCSKCGKYYFTKKQVVACFDADSSNEEN